MSFNIRSRKSLGHEEAVTPSSMLLTKVKLNGQSYLLVSQATMVKPSMLEGALAQFQDQGRTYFGPKEAIRLDSE